MSAARRAGVAAAFAAAVVCAAPAAVRADAGEWRFGVDAFGAALHPPGVWQLGAGAGVHAAYGLSTAWSLAASASWRAVLPATDLNGDPVTAKHLAGAVVGATFALDVFRIVPFLTAGAGAYVVGSKEGVRLAPAAELGLSLEYLLTRSIAVGVELGRARLLWLDGALVWGVDFGLRASYVLW
ncbi:MAG TPA: hypothetical protein VG389_21065 [Myxococcota bacterium]|nr:hypothetical protein [Myxococcota bacterium]